MRVSKSITNLVLALITVQVGCGGDSGDVSSPADAHHGDVIAADDTLASDGEGDLLDRPRDAGGNGEVLLELTPDLCDDPSLMATLQASMMSAPPPSYGTPNIQQVLKMVQTPTEGPFYMVNLIKFRDQAVYPDGRETTLTGEEANLLYSPVDFLSAIGAEIVFGGPVSLDIEGPEGDWDEVGIVEYPCPLAFFAMAAHPEFQARSVHKEAGVERSIVMVTYPTGLPEVTPDRSPFPATEDDLGFERVEVIRYRDDARYSVDSGEPARSGEAAMEIYSDVSTQAAADVGISPLARLSVDGVFIGDGRAWDQVRIDAIPSGAALAAYQSDPEVVSVALHREAAIDEISSVGVTPLIDTTFP